MSTTIDLSWCVEYVVDHELDEIPDGVEYELTITTDDTGYPIAVVRWEEPCKSLSNTTKRAAT